MKLLFIIENIDKYRGASADIGIELACELKELGHEISIISKVSDESLFDKEKAAAFKYTDIFIAKADVELRKFEEKTNWKMLDGSQKRKIIAKNMTDYISYIFPNEHLYEFSYISEFKEKIKKICNDHSFDAIIGVAAPYYIPISIAKSKVDVKKILLQFDPFSDNKQFSKKAWIIRRLAEKYAMSKLDYIFALDCFAEELKSNNPKQKEIIETIAVPRIKKDNWKEKPSVKNHIINCVFCGLFYPGIREPNFTLELFQELPDNYVLNLVGFGCEDQINKYTSLGNRLIRHGKVGKEEAQKYMNDADLLINIDNNSSNQIPSKIFEYFNTGLPIINICNSKNCLSIEYMNRYSNAVNIYTSDPIELSIERICDFCSTNLLKQVQYKEIEDLFEESTYLYVAKRIVDEVC